MSEDMSETMPAPALACWRANKTVFAGKIHTISATGCQVEAADGSIHFRAFPKAMLEWLTRRPLPAVGDYWVIFADGWQMIMPAWSFTTDSGGFERIAS